MNVAPRAQRGAPRGPRVPRAVAAAAAAAAAIAPAAVVPAAVAPPAVAPAAVIPPAIAPAVVVAPPAPILLVGTRAAFVRCGFNNATADFIFDEGFETPEDLLLVTTTDLRDLVRNASRHLPANVSFPFLAVKKLMAFRHWVSQRSNTGDIITAASFTDDECSSALMELRSSEERDDTEKSMDITKADALKTIGSWFKFNEKFINYISQIRGRAKAPLSYLIRAHVEVTDALRAADYASTDERLNATLLHSGAHYSSDNKRLWTELKTLTVDGTGWTYIKRFNRTEDGRAAYMALKAQCEGNSALHTKKVTAYNQIEKARYGGERKLYNFAKYVEAHLTGYNDILDADPDEIIPEPKRVRDFLHGITDQSLQSGIDFVLSNPTMLASFEDTQQYLGTLVANRKQHTAGQRDNRAVAAIKKSPSAKIEDKWYTPDEWRKLNKDEKAEVTKLAQARKLKQKKTKRKLSALKKAKSAKKETNKDDDTTSEEDTEEPMNDKAGNQFGRNSHAKKKSKRDT